MEHKDNHNYNNGSGNGFLLGIIVGVLITLLFTTKRGRAILKDLMEKGVEKFANLEQLIRETEDLDDELEDEDGDDYIAAKPIEEPEPPKIQKVGKKIEVTPQPPLPISTLVETVPKVEKPVKQDAPQFLDEADENEITEEELTSEQKPARSASLNDTAGEEKTKTTRVKRLFRGLRKKS